MREIKFRVWDKNENKFYYFDLNNGCNFTPDMLKEASQYTGLKDRNGKEIYEEDVVKVLLTLSPNKIFFIGYVRFAKGKFYIDCPYYAPNLDTCGHENEVIGNIHETPELLKGKE